MVKSGEKLEKVGGNGKSGEKLEKVGKGGEKWGKVGKSGKGGVKCFFIFFSKMAAGDHLGCPKITFDHSSCHFISIRNFFF